MAQNTPQTQESEFNKPSKSLSSYKELIASYEHSDIKFCVRKMRQRDLEEEKKYTERNKTQQKLIITLSNIDEIFESDPTQTKELSYEKLLNLCRQKITKYFKTERDFITKEELANMALIHAYSGLKRKLIFLSKAKMESPDNDDKEIELTYYISQFYSYINFIARNEAFWCKFNQNAKKHVEFNELINYSEINKEKAGCAYDEENVMMEFQIDNFIDNSMHINNDSENDILNQDYENDDDVEEEIKKEEEKQIRKRKLSCHNFAITGNENIFNDMSLDMMENVLSLESTLNKYKIFTNEEKEVLKSIYAGRQNLEIFNKQEIKNIIKSVRSKLIKDKKISEDIWDSMTAPGEYKENSAMNLYNIGKNLEVNMDYLGAIQVYDNIINKFPKTKIIEDVVNSLTDCLKKKREQNG